MRHDPIEIGRRSLAARATAERVSRLASRLTRHSRPAPTSQAADAIDEAFAGFHASGSRRSRVDRPVDSVSPGAGAAPDSSEAAAAWEPVKREIIADLSAQLELLDNQRERLARLLRTIQ